MKTKCKSSRNVVRYYNLAAVSSCDCLCFRYDYVSERNFLCTVINACKIGRTSKDRTGSLTQNGYKVQGDMHEGFKRRPQCNGCEKAREPPVDISIQQSGVSSSVSFQGSLGFSTLSNRSIFLDYQCNEKTKDPDNFNRNDDREKFYDAIPVPSERFCAVSRAFADTQIFTLFFI